MIKLTILAIIIIVLWICAVIELKRVPLLKEEESNGLSPVGQLNKLFIQYKGDTSKILEKIEKEIESSKKLKDKRGVWMKGNYWREVKRQYYIYISDNVIYE